MYYGSMHVMCTNVDEYFICDFCFLKIHVEIVQIFYKYNDFPNWQLSFYETSQIEYLYIC